MHVPTLSPLRRIAFLREVTALGTTAIYERIKAGLLTPPVKLARSSAWPEHEIAVINAAIIGGKSDSEIRALVARLVAERTRAPETEDVMARARQALGA